MKKVIALMLVLVIGLSLWGCGKQAEELPAAVNPIVGIWEAKSADEERVFTFTETDGTLAGSYKYYNYKADKWGEFTFTVKEQTENSVTLLVDDGTMDQIPYFILGDRMYIDGVIFTSNTVEVPVVSSLDPFPYEVNTMQTSLFDELFDYDGLFFGMHMRDVETVIDQQPEWGGNGMVYDYDWYSSCGYYTDLSIDHADYYCIRIGLDANQRLVHMQGQGSYEEEQFNRWQKDFTERFGEPEYSNRIYSPQMANKSDSLVETWIWAATHYVIELKIATDIDKDVPSYSTITCYYQPKN